MNLNQEAMTNVFKCRKCGSLMTALKFKQGPQMNL